MLRPFHSLPQRAREGDRAPRAEGIPREEKVSIQFNEAAIPGRHTITYRIRDAHRNYPLREVEVLATADEIEALARDGYLVRERLLPAEEIERLRVALDETVARDDRLETKGGR